MIARTRPRCKRKRTAQADQQADRTPLTKGGKIASGQGCDRLAGCSEQPGFQLGSDLKRFALLFAQGTEHIINEFAGVRADLRADLVLQKLFNISGQSYGHKMTLCWIRPFGKGLDLGMANVQDGTARPRHLAKPPKSANAEQADQGIPQTGSEIVPRPGRLPARQGDGGGGLSPHGSAPATIPRPVCAFRWLTGAAEALPMACNHWLFNPSARPAVTQQGGQMGRSVRMKGHRTREVLQPDFHDDLRHDRRF